MASSKSENIEAYIARFPKEVQDVLQQIRAKIKEIAPEAEETISYDMPTFNLYGTYLVYFAAFKKHIGMYSVPTGHPDFDAEFAQYKTGSGSVQFPLNKPMPLDFIERIVRYKVEENKKKATLKK